MSEHHPVFSRFVPYSGNPEINFEIDFLGCKTRLEFWPEFLRSSLPPGSYPPFDEEYFEWVDLLESVVQAKDSYTMVELGAGFGRWSARAAHAVRQYSGLPFHLAAVEAEPTHFAWLSQNFTDNGIVPGEHTLIHAAVAEQPGELWFNVAKPGLKKNAATEWYGQSINRRFRFLSRLRGWRSVKVRAVTLSEVLAPLRMVDLLDIDIQGEELKVVGASLREIGAKVKRLHIGTHGREIENELRRILLESKWECLADYACASVTETPWGRISFADGVQSWINPKLK